MKTYHAGKGRSSGALIYGGLGLILILCLGIVPLNGILQGEGSLGLYLLLAIAILLGLYIVWLALCGALSKPTLNLDESGLSREGYFPKSSKKNFKLQWVEISDIKCMDFVPPYFLTAKLVISTYKSSAPVVLGFGLAGVFDVNVFKEIIPYIQTHLSHLPHIALMGIPGYPETGEPTGGHRLIIEQVDKIVANDDNLRAALIRLVEIYRDHPEGFVTGQGGISETEIRQIGSKLNVEGGMDRMRVAHEYFANIVNVRGAPRNLESLWGGIGEWRG